MAGNSNGVKKAWKARRSKTYPLKSCHGCGQMFHPPAGQGQYCSPKCRDHAKYLRFNKAIRENRKSNARKMWKNGREKWGRIGIQSATSQIIARSEEYIAEQLPHHGFSNIHLMRAYYTFFPFDIIADKDGEKCAIDVTFSMKRDFTKRRIAILEILGIRKFFVVHLKPDFSFYLIKELPQGQHASRCLKTILEMK